MFGNKRDDGKYALCYQTFYIQYKGHIYPMLLSTLSAMLRKSINEKYIVATKGKTKKKIPHMCVHKLIFVSFFFFAYFFNFLYLLLRDWNIAHGLSDVYIFGNIKRKEKRRKFSSVKYFIKTIPNEIELYFHDHDIYPAITVTENFPNGCLLHKL